MNANAKRKAQERKVTVNVRVKHKARWSKATENASEKRKARRTKATEASRIDSQRLVEIKAQVIFRKDRLQINCISNLPGSGYSTF